MSRLQSYKQAAQPAQWSPAEQPRRESATLLAPASPGGRAVVGWKRHRLNEEAALAAVGVERTVEWTEAAGAAVSGVHAVPAVRGVAHRV